MNSITLYKTERLIFVHTNIHLAMQMNGRPIPTTTVHVLHPIAIHQTPRYPFETEVLQQHHHAFFFTGPPSNGGIVGFKLQTDRTIYARIHKTPIDDAVVEIRDGGKQKGMVF